jgi:hypothetical protein
MRFSADYHQQYLAKYPDGYCGIGGCGVPFNLAESPVGEKALRLVRVGFHQKANGLPIRYALFCGKTQRKFGVEVYRKSSGVLDLE